MKHLPIHRNIGTTALLSLLLLSGPSAAGEGKVIPISPKDKKELALLGPGVVGKSLPAHPITDPEKYLNLGPGTWEFKIVSGKNKDKTQAESFIKLADKRWQRKIGDEYLEFISIGTDQSSTKTAETASKFATHTILFLQTPGCYKRTGEQT